MQRQPHKKRLELQAHVSDVLRPSTQDYPGVPATEGLISSNTPVDDIPTISRRYQTGVQDRSTVTVNNQTNIAPNRLSVATTAVSQINSKAHVYTQPFYPYPLPHAPFNGFWQSMQPLPAPVPPALQPLQS